MYKECTCPLVVLYGIDSCMTHSKAVYCFTELQCKYHYLLKTQKVSLMVAANKILIPDDAQCLSDSRRLVLANLTTHLKGSSRSVMVLLVWSLNFVSS